METTTLNVYGMACDHCEEAVKNALLKVDGVTAVTVSILNGTAEVQYKASEASLKELKEAIKNQGYDAV